MNIKELHNDVKDVSAKSLFKTSEGNITALQIGDYIPIESLVLHWVKGVADSQLLLIK